MKRLLAGQFLQEGDIVIRADGTVVACRMVVAEGYAAHVVGYGISASESVADFEVKLKAQRALALARRFRA